ncbi:MAG: hypothetical protein AUG49_10540 [Catenulispora sp. 13_1_20CM_3_70_7]|nr:MAG: hypothetical protein AUG49_10540 [Catenulispora sp. 13_1_20CM_3_70_7]
MIPAKWLANVSLAAGVAFTATAEYSLARRLGAQELVAVMLPVAIDAYAIAALKRFRAFDIALSLMLMCAAQVSAHLLDSHVMPVNGWLVTVVSLLVPVAIWRTHALARGEHDAPAEPPAKYTEAVEVERVLTDTPPVPEAHPAIAQRMPEIPEAVPPGARLLPIVARPQVRGEYVPDPPKDRVPEDEKDPFEAMEMGWAAEQFKTELFAGELPSIRAIKDRLSVGQDKAKQIQEAFREARVAYRLAGQGASS